MGGYCCCCFSYRAGDTDSPDDDGGGVPSLAKPRHGLTDKSLRRSGEVCPEEVDVEADVVAVSKFVNDSTVVYREPEPVEQSDHVSESCLRAAFVLQGT